MPGARQKDWLPGLGPKKLSNQADLYGHKKTALQCQSLSHPVKPTERKGDQQPRSFIEKNIRNGGGGGKPVYREFSVHPTPSG